MSAFGCLVPGRLVTTAFMSVDETHFTLDIPAIGHAKHLSVFLTAENLLPEGYGAAIHFALPPYQNWSYLGGITNSKPSATFRLNVGTDNSSVEEAVGRLGLEIVPIQALEQLQQTKMENITPSQQGMLDRVGRKLFSNLQDFIQSHAAVMMTEGGQMTEAVSSKAFDRWIESVNRRIRLNPKFWDGV
ncbi:Protein of unknown function DUF775 [Carpediemonas membranifera]|uniref:Hikeshi-like domain-containing protein n=1 Tax=Carpediemonas membranifera TaxID=201153 RepID=A0A8J6DXX7_9EUKA|nr:Protein of unknown function DUF775 [Carpediemonas membranifera]|eukprot:KAG9391179.1 Protein of unknown function DUF775 [Carpediemonas membranifera]